MTSRDAASTSLPSDQWFDAPPPEPQTCEICQHKIPVAETAWLCDGKISCELYYRAMQDADAAMMLMGDFAGPLEVLMAIRERFGDAFCQACQTGGVTKAPADTSAATTSPPPSPARPPRSDPSGKGAPKSPPSRPAAPAAGSTHDTDQDSLAMADDLMQTWLEKVEDDPDDPQED